MSPRMRSHARRQRSPRVRWHCSRCVGGCGCGSSAGRRRERRRDASRPRAPAPATVLETLGHVGDARLPRGRLERTHAKSRCASIERSIAAARSAVEHGDASGAHAAAQRTVCDRTHDEPDGPPRQANARRASAAPRARTTARLDPAAPTGKPIASFMTSVWADTGFIAEMRGVAEGESRCARAAHGIGGSFAASGRKLLDCRHAHAHGVRLPVHIVPGRALSRPARCASTCCGRSARPPPLRRERTQDTLVNTLSRIAH